MIRNYQLFLNKQVQNKIQSVFVLSYFNACNDK